MVKLTREVSDIRRMMEKNNVDDGTKEEDFINVSKVFVISIYNISYY
jgi:hypothetical protein